MGVNFLRQCVKHTMSIETYYLRGAEEDNIDFKYRKYFFIKKEESSETD